MKLSDFDYNLPKNLIAQEPIKPRDHSRLLILSRDTKEAKPLRFSRIDSSTNDKIVKNRSGLASLIEHKYFYDFVDYLQKGDVLVLNDTKVFPARLIGKRQKTGGKVEVFLLRKVDRKDFISAPPTSPLPSPCKGEGDLRSGSNEVWQCLVGGHRRKANLVVEFNNGLIADILKDNGDGTFLVGFNKKGQVLMDTVNKIGQVPLPPYIKRESKLKTDDKNYQTVYADDKKNGSVAAPTAGFHFTPALIKKLKKKGVEFEYVTLHVGLGTFAPVKVDDITKHKMHSEWVEVKAGVIKNIIKAKEEGRRIITVGTTSVRTLESIFNDLEIGNWKLEIRNEKKSKIRILKQINKDYQNWTNIYIYPGYKFKVVDAMITNFHLPKSTLLMLVSAFAGQDKIKTAYEEAVKKKYRFFSYGDAMFIY